MNLRSETQTQERKVLLIEGNPEDARLIFEMLAKTPVPLFDLEWVDRLSAGLERMAQDEVDLILLDLSLPDSRGLDTFDKINGYVLDVPVLILSKLDDENLAIRAIKKGAQDYIVKGQMDRKLLIRSMLYAIERYGLLKELGQANQKVLVQQKRVIEEERFNVFLQMAGATVRELNQPLMGLLGDIDLMRESHDNPELMAQYMDRIEEDGQRTGDSAKRIQIIRHDETKLYLSTSSIVNHDQKVALLSVENSDDDFRKISGIMKHFPQISLSRAITVKEAMKELENNHFDLVFLDHILPDGDSVDVLELIDIKGLEVPVVVITGEGDEMIASRAIQAGAYDYLPKHKMSETALSRSINNTLEKFRLKRKVKMAMEKMAEMCTRDELTGLYNRRFFIEALEREIARSIRYKAELLVCFMDLDHFKRINDTLGHCAGDMVLSQIGKLLRECIRESELICRYGGEEFAAILPNTGIDKAHIVCERFRKAVARHAFKYNSSQLRITVSIGSTSFHYSNPETIRGLISNADKALYRAKALGRNKVVVSKVRPSFQQPAFSRSPDRIVS